MEGMQRGISTIVVIVSVVVLIAGVAGVLVWRVSVRQHEEGALKEQEPSAESPKAEPLTPTVPGQEPVPSPAPTRAPELIPGPEPEPQPQPEAQPQPVESPTPSPQEVQEFEIVQTIYPGKFDPSQIVVKKGIPVKIYLTTTQREHINRVSILPYITSSDTILPGKVTVIEFTPLEAQDLKIRNIGHGFTGTIKVIN